MTMHVNVSGTYQQVLPTGFHVKVSGSWEQVQQGWVKVSGEWEQFYQAGETHAAAITLGNDDDGSTWIRGYADSTLVAFGRSAFGSIDDATYGSHTINGMYMSGEISGETVPSTGIAFFLAGSVPNTDEAFIHIDIAEIVEGVSERLLRSQATYADYGTHTVWSWDVVYDMVALPATWNITVVYVA